MVKEMDKILKDILVAIKDRGGKPYFVGGTVRDEILGMSSKDTDIEVYNLPLEDLTIVLSKFGRVDIVGDSFGVLKLHGLNADFSVPRRDNKIGIGHKGFKVAQDPNMSLEEAASRRDLTMNSMAKDPLTGKIFDPFDGKKDIEAGIMRATSSKTFLEDSLRALRTMQFAARFEMTADEELVKLCSQADLSDLPGERQWEEWKKMMIKGRKPSLGLQLLKEAGLLKFYPELASTVGCSQDPIFHAEGDVFVHTMMVLDIAATMRNGDKDHDLCLMFGASCHDYGKAVTSKFDPIKGREVSNGHDEAGVPLAEEFLRRLKAPEKVIQQVRVLVREHLKPFTMVTQGAKKSAYRRMIRRMEGVPLSWLGELALADEEGRICKKKATKQTPDDVKEFLRRAEDIGVVDLTKPNDIVRGRHLIARGFVQGPKIGEILTKCKEVQDEMGWTDADMILEKVLGPQEGM